MLIRHARDGHLVVRLKGGDPMLFGRAGEEAEALADAGVPFRIVPGVTAAAAAAACAGVPLTDRRRASSVVFVTGRQDPGKADADIDWPALARADTIVLYMGVGRLAEIVARLIQAGRQPNTPAVIVASAQGKHGIGLGNIVGSNIINVIGILGAAVVIMPITVNRGEISITTIIAFVGASLYLLFCLLFRQKITRIDGLILVTAFVLYSWFSYSIKPGP